MVPSISDTIKFPLIGGVFSSEILSDNVSYA